MWHDMNPYDWLNKLYNVYMAATVGIISRHGDGKLTEDFFSGMDINQPYILKLVYGNYQMHSYNLKKTFCHYLRVVN